MVYSNAGSHPYFSLYMDFASPSCTTSQCFLPTAAFNRVYEKGNFPLITEIHSNVKRFEFIVVNNYFVHYVT